MKEKVQEDLKEGLVIKNGVRGEKECRKKEVV